jgi:hypothetical protein
VTEHDVLVGYRMRLVTQADEVENVSEACRLMSVHHSTYTGGSSSSTVGGSTR